MAKVTPLKSRKTLRPTFPSRDIEIAYATTLQNAVIRMAKDVEQAVSTIYEGAEVRIETSAEGGRVADARPPAVRIAEQLNRDYRKWQRYFDDLSKRWGSWFAKRVATYVKNDMSLAFKDASFKARLTQNGRVALDDIISVINAENTALIKTIPQQYIQRVSIVVNESVKRGRDLNYLTKELKKAYNITDGRARTIARDQNNKSTEAVSLTRVQAYGITHGYWLHRSGGKVPRNSHQKASGTRFELNKGCYIDGEWIFPAQKVNCHCTYVPEIPEEDDE